GERDALHAPDADGVDEQIEPEERPDDGVRRFREPSPEEDEAGALAADLEGLQKVRDREEREQDREDGEHPAAGGGNVRVRAHRHEAGQLTVPSALKGGTGGLGAGSPGSSEQSVHSWFDQAGSSIRICSTHSTKGITPPFVSVYILSLPQIVCRDPAPM